MVVAVEARKITLSSSSSSSSSSVIPSQPISLLFDPGSLTLALILSDSSISLHYPFCPFSLPSSRLPPTKTLIPPATSAATFLRLSSSPPNPTSSCPNFFPTLLISAGTTTTTTNEGGGESFKPLVLRIFVKANEDAEFVRTRLTCGQKGIDFDRKSGGVVVSGVDGSSKVALAAGSVNYFAMYSASTATTNSSVWVFGVKIDERAGCEVGEGGGDGLVLKLVKCAVINCTLTVSSICLSSRLLIIGEVNGVRVFPLRPLVKGKKNKKGKKTIGSELEEKKKVKVNVNGEVFDLKVRRIIKGGEKIFDLDTNLKDDDDDDQSRLKVMEDDSDTHGCSGAVKSASLKLNQEDSCDWGASFVPFCGDNKPADKSNNQAVSIHCFSQQKFLILDSSGHVHILYTSVSDPPYTMKELTGAMNVEQLALLSPPAMLPDSSQIVIWLCDGPHSVHTKTMSSDVGSSGSGNEIEWEEDVQSSVSQVIFTSERIQEMIPLSASAVMILGQDNLYVYGIF